MVKEAGSRTLALSAADRRFNRTRPGEIRSRRINRYWQADFARAFVGYSPRRRKFPILCYSDFAHGIGSAHHRQRRVQLHVAAAARYRRADFSMEPPALL